MNSAPLISLSLGIIAVICTSPAIKASTVDNQDYTPSSGAWIKNNDGTAHEHKGALFSAFRYSLDNKATNTYKYEIGPPASWSFISSKTTFNGGVKVDEPTDQYAGIKKTNNASEDPASFTVSMDGKLTKPGEAGGTVSWSASAGTEFFYLTSSPHDVAAILVPVGTSVTISAKKNGKSEDCKWKIDNTSLGGNPTESCITLKKSTAVWWNPFSWFSYDYPIAGNYTVWACSVDSDIARTKQITYLDTYFPKGTSPGYDDFTDWQKDEDSSNKAAAYYASPQNGQAGVVYVAVKKGTSNSSVNLNLNPPSVPKDIEITKTGASVSIDKTKTKTSTAISLNAGAVGETTIKAKLDAHNFPRYSVICNFSEKITNYWLVYVGAEYNGATIYPKTPPSLSNINTTLQQAISGIQLTNTASILFNNHPSVVKVANKDIYMCQWNQEKINEFIVLLSPPANTGVILILHGYMEGKQTTFGLSTTGGRKNEVSFIWTGASAKGAYLTMDRPYIIPHEISHHFLGGSHVSNDKHNLMSEDSDFDNLGKYNLLRKNQWGGFHD